MGGWPEKLVGFRIGERCTLKIGGRLTPKTSGRWEVETLPQSFSVLAHYSCDWADEERESIKQTNPSIISWWTPKILHLLA